jgi:hypothetical protein
MKLRRRIDDLPLLDRQPISVGAACLALRRRSLNFLQRDRRLLPDFAGKNRKMEGAENFLETPRDEKVLPRLRRPLFE